MQLFASYLRGNWRAAGLSVICAAVIAGAWAPGDSSRHSRADCDNLDIDFSGYLDGTSSDADIVLEWSIYGPIECHDNVVIVTARRTTISALETAEPSIPRS
jgi:hypothetical protein